VLSAVCYVLGGGREWGMDKWSAMDICEVLRTHSKHDSNDSIVMMMVMVVMMMTIMMMIMMMMMMEYTNRVL
jgi:hypothetical protein